MFGLVDRATAMQSSPKEKTAEKSKWGENEDGT
jgi:hypothetical protein